MELKRGGLFFDPHKTTLTGRLVVCYCSAVYTTDRMDSGGGGNACGGDSILWILPCFRLHFPTAETKYLNFVFAAVRNLSQLFAFAQVGDALISLRAQCHGSGDAVALHA